MIEFLAIQVRMGNIAIDQVPLFYRDSVQALINKMEG